MQDRTPKAKTGKKGGVEWLQTIYSAQGRTEERKIETLLRDLQMVRVPSNVREKYSPEGPCAVRKKVPNLRRSEAVSDLNGEGFTSQYRV